jgi:hypothetical protein
VSTNPNTQIPIPAHLDQITVSDRSAGVASSSHAFNVLGPFAGFTFSKFPAPLGVNQPFKLVVRAVDRAGNIVTGYTGSPTWADHSRLLSPSSPAPFVNGVSVNSCVRVGSVQADDQIRVNDSAHGGISDSPTFSVNASQVFSTAGSYTFALPCAASITSTAIGAGGGSTPAPCGFGNPGGEGGSVTASVAVSAGELTAGVGGAGGAAGSCSAFGGGGAGGTGSGANGGDGGSAYQEGGGGGGGASFLSTGTGSPTTSSVLLVGGGGGGAAGYEDGGSADSAGSLQPPACPAAQSACGGGAGTSAGTPPDVGSGGASDGAGGSYDGSDGGFLSGGNGGNGTEAGEWGGGGGGSGYYGGGAEEIAGSGGGGQSFIASSATNTSGPTATGSPAEVSITYAPST